jgi:hypothetical protein
MMARTPRAPAKPQGEREQRELECVLTEAEVLARGDAMSAAELEIRTHKSTRKGITGTINDLAEKRLKLAEVIETGKEKRKVDCEWLPDYAVGQTVCTRLDTNEVIETRPLTSEDRQTGLALVPDAADADPQPDGTVAVTTARTPRRASKEIEHTYE